MEYYAGQHIYILKYIRENELVIDSEIEELEILGVANTKSWRKFYITRKADGSSSQTMEDYIYPTMEEAEDAKAYLTTKKKFFINLQAPYGNARLLVWITSTIWLILCGIVTVPIYNLESLQGLPLLAQTIIAGFLLCILGSGLSEIDALWNCMAVPSSGPKWMHLGNDAKNHQRKKWRERLGIQLNKEDIVRLDFR